jgi:formaldehyde-activating enzyme involved in methanogenesis
VEAMNNMADNDTAKDFQAHVNQWVDQTAKDYAALTPLDLSAHKRALDEALRIKAEETPQRAFERKLASSNTTMRDIEKIIYEADEPLRAAQRKNHHV